MSKTNKPERTKTPDPPQIKNPTSEKEIEKKKRELPEREPEKGQSVKGKPKPKGR